MKRLVFGCAIGVVLVLVAALIFFACRARQQPSPQPIVAGQPTIKIDWPLNGARVRVGQAFQMHATATDPSGITGIGYAIDDQIGTPVTSSAPQTTFSAAIPVTLSAKGVHTLAVQSMNAAGVQSAPVTIRVVAKQNLSDPSSADEPPPPVVETPSNPPDPSSIESSPSGTSVYFSATPSTISAGGCSNVRWDVEGAREVYFEGIPVTGHEQRQQCPTQTTTYTLHVVFQDGSAQDYTATVSVSAVAACSGRPNVVQAFRSSPSQIAPGGSSTLSWQVTNADRVEIDQGIGSVPLEGSRAVSPSQTTSYTLTARCGAEQETTHALVTVTGAAVCSGRPNVVEGFRSTPSQIPAGGSSTLSWKVTNADRVEIDQGVGNVPLDGPVTVRPAQTTSYTLTAHCGAEQVTTHALVTVTGPVAKPDLVVTGSFSEPAVQGQPFTASVIVTNQGTSAAGAFTVRWHFEAQVGLADCNWDSPGLGAGQQWRDSCTRTPSGHGRIQSTLTADVEREIAESNEGNNELDLTLTVSATAACSGTPNIASFTANPSAIASGHSSDLVWGVINADSIEIDHGIGVVTDAGSRAVRPASTTTYTLTARCGNQSKTKQVTVQVNPAFAVTEVTASADPPSFTGVCPQNVNVTFSAKITTNGPGTVTYKWINCSKCPTDPPPVEFLSAGTKTVSSGALSYTADVPSLFIVKLQVTSPNSVTSNEARFSIACSAPFAVTGVTASADPPSFTGPCPHKVTYSGKITTNGPGDVTYNWKHDSGDGGPKTLHFDRAGSKSVANSEMNYAHPGDHWAILHVSQPNVKDSNQAKFTLTCGKPDLVVLELTLLESTVWQGHDALRVSFRVVNQGNAPAGASKARWYAAGSNLLSFICNVPALGVGGGVGTSFTCIHVFRNVNDDPKNYGTWAEADIENAVDETNENNNKSDSVVLTVVP